jgi:GNAT superfamily N-acetyltransferase
MPDITIVPWEEKYAGDFIALSMEWLEKYALTEPADLEILHHPHEKVLDHGGNIFFALYQGEVIGTAAMIQQDAETFELAKLAVTEQYKGLKISTLLMQRCLDFAKAAGAKKILLYTNSFLRPAIGLYKKFNFVEAPIEQNIYEKVDMKMELAL